MCQGVEPSPEQEAFEDFLRTADPECLASIVFDEMIGDEHDEEIGFRTGVLESLSVQTLVTIEGTNITVAEPDKTIFSSRNLIK